MGVTLSFEALRQGALLVLRYRTANSPLMLAFAVVFTLLLTICALPVLGADARRPNILLILTDDMGYGDITCYSRGVGVSTPNIDGLASQGAKFTQYYVAAPICSPSRAAILTGQFPARNHLNSYLQRRAGNRNCEQNDYLDPSVPTMARALRQAGYATGHFGKWHMGGGRDVTNAPHIAQYGFDEWSSTTDGPDPDPALGIKYSPWDRELEPGQVPRHKRTEYMVDRTLDFLRRHKAQPCYVNLWPDDVHTPHRPSPEMQRKYGGGEDERKTPLRNFKGVIEEYDRQMGRLFRGLQDLGLDKDTIVIFTSDNGPEPHFDHMRTGGLRGMKVSLYEGGVRVPFIVRWPGHVPSAYVDSTTVLASVDLQLTLCRLAGAKLPEQVVSQQDGEDMSDVLLGKPKPRTKPLLWEYGRKIQGYGYPDIGRPDLHWDRSPNVAVRSSEWKLLINDNGTSGELYNIAANDIETTSLASTQTSVVDDLSSLALSWRKTLPGRTQP